MDKIDDAFALHQHRTQTCNIENRTIFCHDNLEILQGINGECIDLIYLDPPFNKNKKFTAPSGTKAEGASFKDIFHQKDVKDEWLRIIAERNPALSRYIDGITDIGYRYNRYYLVYMAIRLIEMHRLLKETGSLYLHCDQTMSHYLKILLDCIFGEDNFRNEIVWGYKKLPNKAKHFQRNKDSILFYSKTENYYFKRMYTTPTKESLKTFETGRRVGYNANHSKKMVTVFDWEKYKEAVKNNKIPSDLKPVEFTGGRPLMRDYWVDIKIIGGPSNPERTGYPTQKPLALLERIITASSDKDDVVLDPFCGCATTCVAAEKLGRRWIGIDISQKAYQLVQERLKQEVWRNPDALYRYKNIPDIISRTDIPHKTTQDSEEFAS